MSGSRRLSLAAITALVLATAATPAAAADPGHPRCTTVTIQDRADLPPGYSVRAVGEGLIYPTWCR